MNHTHRYAERAFPNRGITVCVTCGQLHPKHLRDKPDSVLDSEQTLRPEVLAFAEAMERQLRANDHKPGWKNDDPRDLIRRLREEALELYDVIRGYSGTPTIEHVVNEAADIANFAMMIADVMKARLSGVAE